MKKFENYTLVSDLDGTLLSDDGTVSKKNIDAIEYFENNGGKFTVATGRTVDRTFFLNDYLNLDLPAIFSNGASIANLSNKEIIWKKNIDDCVKEVVYDFYQKHKDFGLIIFSDKNDYFINPEIYKNLNPDLSGFNFSVNKVEDIKTPYYKVVIISETNILDYLNNEYEKYLDKIYFTRSNTYFYEIMDRSICKGKAVDKLKEICDIKNNKIIAVGDNLNDIDMIEYADIGVAVCNGCDELIKKADISVTRDNAIYNLIEKLS